MRLPILLLTVLLLVACGRASSPFEERIVTRVVTRVVTEIVTVQVAPGPPTMPLEGDQVAETEHFAFYVKDGYRPLDVDALAVTAERLHQAVRAELRLDEAALPNEPLLVFFEPPADQPCPPRGLTFNAEPGPRLLLYVDEQTDPAQVKGVLAHEIAHALHSTGLGPDLGGDRALSEGLASWAARDSYAAWQGVPSLTVAVRDYLATGAYVPLTEMDLNTVFPFGDAPAAADRRPADCLARRDQYYTQWAVFIDYLIQRDGWDAFLALLASAAPEVLDDGQIIPHDPDYQAVYGRPLAELEAEWLATLSSG